MAFVMDNLLFLVTSSFWVGKPDKFERPSDISVRSNLVTVLMPAKYESYEAMKQTILNINSQTVVPEIWIIIDIDDVETLQFAEKLQSEFDNVSIISFRNGSKAHALNKAVEFVTTEYVLIIDCGDVFKNSDAIENLLKIAEKGYDAVVSMLSTQPTNSWWKRILAYEMNMWTSLVLRKIKRKYGFIPFPGTGLLIRTEVLRKNPFPETLAEDASLGLKIRNVAITDTSMVLYNLPRRLRDHLRQRARWMAGYLQTLPIAKGRQKLIFITPIIQGLVPVSLLLMPITMKLGLYDFPWIIVDWLAGVFLMYCILKYLIRTRDPICLLLPLWWLIIGFAFYGAIKYAVKNEWYHSPKDVIVEHSKLRRRAIYRR